MGSGIPYLATSEPPPNRAYPLSTSAIRASKNVIFCVNLHMTGPVSIPIIKL